MVVDGYNHYSGGDMDNNTFRGSDDNTDSPQ
jgi:hypothetical protein